MKDLEITPFRVQKFQFLAGGGEMGALTRAKDWSKNPVGPVEAWPQSLRTTLGILLNSRFPMFLWWGPDLICFYNDAYRPSLGQNGKHPAILGKRAEEAWPEIWDTIKPLIDQVLAGGEATWSEDQLIPIYRNGKLEDVYWTFSYSPVKDELGKVAGVLVTCSETTQKIITLKSLEESNQRYLRNIIQAPVAMCIFRGKNHVVEIANGLMLELWGKTEEQVMNMPILEGLPEAKEQGLEKLLDYVYHSGEKFVANEHAVNLPRNGKIGTTYINFVCEALKEPDETVTGIVTIASEVTLQVSARKKIEESEERFRTMAEGTDILIAVGDETSNATYFNKAWVDLTGRPMEHLLKFGWADLLHPEDQENYLSVYLKAFKERKAFTGEFRILNKEGEYRWLLAKGPPRFKPDGTFAGYISSCIDITERKQTEQEKQKLAAIIKASSEFIGLADLNTSAQYMNPAALQMLGWDNFYGRRIIDCVYPDDREFAKEILLRRLETGSFQHEIRFWNEKTGEPFWLQWNGIAIKDPVSDETIGLATVSPNITERKRVEKAFKESEQRFRNLIMQSPVPMAVLKSGDNIIEIANTAMFEKIWRKKEAGVLGARILDVFPELKEQKYPELLDKVYKTGKTHREFESITYVQGDDGLKKFYLDFEYAPLFEPDGTVSGIIITLNDVTEKVEAKQLLKESVERLVLATEGTQLATWDLNLQTSDIVYSPRLAQIFGYADETKILTHKQMREHIHPDDIHTVVEKAFDNALKTGVYYYQARIIHPDNTIHWIRTRGKVIFDDSNVPVRMLGTIIDITDSQIAEENIARMAAIVHSSDDAIVSKSLEGIVTTWNAGAERIFGYTAEEMIGQPILKLIPSDKFTEEPNILNQLKRGERVDHFETKRITKDKRILDVSLTISPVRDTNGNIIGASKIARDITKQKEAERLISVNEQKFRLLADSMPQFIWTGDVNGNLNYFNKSVFDYSGLNPEDFNNDGWVQIVHPEDREENVRIWMDSVNTGRDFIFEHRFRRYDGEYRWQLSRAIPQRDAAGNIQMWVGTSTDIEEIKQMDQQKDYFISMASHELKTPITSMKGYVQILQSIYVNSEDAFLKKSLNVIDKQIITLTNLVTDLLDLSKIKSGSLHLNIESFEINELVEQAINEIELINPGYSIIFSKETETIINGDRERIGQVIINFLTNAVKYSPGSKTVKISIAREEKSVVVSVKDTGIGISKRDQQKIFERFYRVEGKNEKRFPGFGIGLFIAAEIIQRHNGKIGVKSKPGKGSIFFFSLPFDGQ